jgi:hypothetical protein
VRKGAIANTNGMKDSAGVSRAHEINGFAVIGRNDVLKPA